MFDFLVMPDGADSYRVTAESRDVVIWERTGRDKSFQGLMDNLRIADLYHIAWLASTRLGLYSGSLKEFETNVDIRPEESEGASDMPDPTQTEALDEFSSGSPSLPASPRRSGRSRAIGK